ncbi:tRNA (cytosine(32)/uridine(32)-2'-O)-methyltransferase TrmJ [Endozoicomonadaceae bacterium StTr2]
MLDSTRIVLVKPSHPGNIGAVARAMKTMGLSHLVMVEPDNFPSDEAFARSSGAKDVLENATICSTVEEALEGCGLVIGTSARNRKIPRPLLNPRTCAETISEKGLPAAIMFGRERTGLTNDELERCHYHVHIPTNAEYSSLNLGAAVQVLCYELRMASLAAGEVENNAVVKTADIASTEAVEGYFSHLEQTLVEIDFLNPDNPGKLMNKLRRLYMRAGLETNELSILRGILSDTQRTIRLAAAKEVVKNEK